ncbi:aminotransferase class I/II-fold pyridoxal phosphate-dependent enzyme [Chelatococcus albus]|uniref:aminotransferase class I/II-fold pyridoxal phosphate-dependent enzyme n=1 Tax=Chelatococcus albus TaxID=3047466 RepID=UPI0030EF93E1
MKLCRAHDVTIIEDDVYALAATAGAPPLAMLAPERTFYVNGLSKTLSPGLRIGVLAPPPGLVEQAETVLRATALMVSPLSCVVMEQWLADGIAAVVTASIRVEAARRRSLAASVLGEAMVHPSRDGFHVWLPMTRARAEQVTLAAAATGIAVTPPGAIATAPDRVESGIRLCLGGPPLADLARALGMLAKMLARPEGHSPHVSG